MGRSRSRSRSPSRGRKRERRSRSPDVGVGGAAQDDRSRFLVTDQQSIAAQMQQQQLAAMQQQQLQKQLLAQQLLMGGGMGLAVPQAVAAAPAAAPDRKQREIYIGNLAIGIITADLLREFFDQVFAHMVPDPVANPPVVNVNMDTTGRFSFVEFRSEEMATKALEMDKVVELCGRAMNIGRPKGYVAPVPGAPPPQPVAPPQPQQAAPTVSVAGLPTTVLLLSNILPAGQLRTESDRRILQEEVYEEAAKYGSVSGVFVAVPTSQVQDLMPGRCYIRYATTEDAAKGKTVFDTRTLDDNVIKASYVSEDEYNRAAAGEWVSKQSGVAGIPLPGLYTIAPMSSGITGLSALNPSLAALVATNPGIAAMMTAGINEDEVPFEEGYVKLRGFPATVTKADIVAFFKSCGPELCEDDIKLVLSADGTSLGEAFVHFRGQRAKVRLALAKDRSVMQAAQCPIEVLTAVGDDLQRRMMSGCMLV